MSGFLWLCCTLSGSAALALEVLWVRSAGLILGTTTATTATVLACYFAGLGGGAVWARRVPRWPVRLYGLLELGVGTGALWSYVVLHALASEPAQVWLLVLGPLGRIAAVAVALMPTTLCLGATLPVLGQILLAMEAVGYRGGLLYACNIFGGALGCLAAGFWLPVVLGVAASYGVTAAVSLLLGAGVLLLGRRRPAVEPGTATKCLSTSVVGRWRLRLVAAATGALGLGLEVLWTRLFAQVLHNSVYSFSAIILVFLFALAVGAGIAAYGLHRGLTVVVASTALLSAGVATIGGIWLFMWWTEGLSYMGMHAGLGEYMGRIIALAAATAGPTAIASGAVLPALWAAWGAEESPAYALGDLSAANLLGGVVGAGATGFLVIPTLGVRGAMLVAAVTYVVLADMLIPSHARLRFLVHLALLAIVMAVPLRAPLVHLRSKTESLRLLREGASGIVTVVDTNHDRQLRLDNYYVLGGSAAATNERRQGLLPLLLHPEPHRVAFIGLATGITASAGPALGVPETVVVELVPEVAQAARTQFASWNARVLEQPSVHLVLDDGRHYLAVSRAAFDVIVSDLFIPWHASAGNLYAREMYDMVARRLAPGGIFCQWLPLYQLTREEFDMLVHTFLTVFPQASLWRGDFFPDRPIVALVGRFNGHMPDLEYLRQRLQQLPAWGRDPLLAAPRGLLMLYAGDLRAVADLFAAAPLNTDDRPRIEFLAPRLTRMTRAGDKDWFTGEALAAFYDTLAGRLADTPAPSHALSVDMLTAWHAGLALSHYALAAARHDDAMAARWQAQVASLVPEVVRAAETEDEGTGVAAAQQQLQELRDEQAQVRQHLEDMERRLQEMTGSTPGQP
jgi:spermidine synthase